MRDIRADLQERLDAAEATPALLEDQRKDLINERDGLQSLYAAESKKWGGASVEKTRDTVSESQTELDIGTPLTRILQDQLADQKKHHLSELAKAAVEKGFSFGEKKPGRVIHFALVNMKSGELVEKLGDGFWRLKTQTRALQ